MGGLDLLQQAIEVAQFIARGVPDRYNREMALLIKDLEQAKTTVFVRTAEANPMVERCLDAAKDLKAIVDAGGWDDRADDAFSSFERAVGKLRNTILVRTQRAT